ncbi:hypothetical protein IW261DRAFT_1471201 [Armillaria novae-zelandiae]|uniref:ZZ-type domain-containing protein n=1 Tax=Armillaria novae-zelandiae TaxID=153914 RepID=A0AA39TDE2_9AGAR|nr:hypothetical protein IW261DRAFT_1471201 [Armillaria novae-zelandiae]
MFTVKATYRGETRKFTFTDTYAFPSFLQLYNQLYRVFPHLSHSYFLSKLLFSPNSSPSRILVAREVHNADEYMTAISNPSLAGRWPSPMLKFSVFDESPHKPPFAGDLGQMRWSSPNWDDQLSPMARPRLSLDPLSSPRPTLLGFPPPPILFSSPARPQTLAPMDVDQFAFPTRSPSPQPRHQPQWANQTLTAFLTATFGSNFLEQQNMPSQPLQNGFGRSFVPPMPCMYHNCAKCFKLFQGPWQSCQKCARIVGPCVETLGPHPYKLERCAGCPKDWQAFDLTDPYSSHTTFRTDPMQPFYTFNTMTPVTPFIPPMVPETPACVPPSLTRGPRAIQTPKPVGTPASPPAAPPIIHHGVLCNCCSKQIEGIRHKCLDCSDYDLCTKCITTGAAERHDPFHEFWEVTEPGRVIVSRVGSTAPPVPAPQVPTQAVTPAVHGATCDLCDSRIRGDRYKCVNCPDFDTCSSCYAITKEQHPHHAFVKISNPADYLRSNVFMGAMHMAVCNACNRSIYGVRYKCMHHECPDFDLCERCEAMPISVHPPNHPLLKMKSADTVIPTVYRVGQTTLIDVDADRGRSPLRLSTPLSYVTRSRSRSRSYDRGVLRNPSWVKAVPCPGGFPFALGTPSPLPSPPMTIPGALPAFTPMSPLMAPTSVQVPVADLSTLFPGVNSPCLSPAASAYIPPCDTPPAGRSPFVTPAYNPTYMTRSPSPPYHPAFNERLPLPDAVAMSLPGFAHTPIPFSSFLSTAGSSTISATDAEVQSVKYPDVVPNSSSHLPSPFDRFRQRYCIDDDDFASGQPGILDDYRYTIPLSSERSTISNKASRPHPRLLIPELIHLMEQPASPYCPTPETFMTPVNQPANIPNDDVIEVKSPVPREEKPVPDVSPSLPPLPPRTFRQLSIPDLLISSQGSLTSETVTLNEKEKTLRSFSCDNLPAIVEAKADFIGDITAPDGQVFPPGAEFMKCWRMKNSGLNDWEESTQLIFVAGESFIRGSGAYLLSVGSVSAGDEVDVWTGELKAPEVPGRYIGYWRLKNGSTGQLFGDSIWIDVVVAEPHRQQVDANEASEAPSSMTSSSVIVMPNAPESLQPLEVTQQRLERLSLSNPNPPSPVTAPSSVDVVSVAGSDESFSGASLVSAPSSDSSDEELWEDSRMNASIVDSQRTAVPSRSNALDYVVLYDENSSSEDDA